MVLSINFFKVHTDSIVPTKAKFLSVGYDVSAYDESIIPAWGQTIVKTGICVIPPEGSYIRLASRSGLASKGLTVQGGVVDPDYTGEVKVILYNHTGYPFTVTKGMKVAQMIAEKYCSAESC